MCLTIFTRMELEHAQSVLSDPDSVEAPKEITTALSTIVKQLSKRSISTTQYSNICRSLLEKLSPYINVSLTQDNDEAENLLEAIFLRGNEYIAFSELYAALNAQNPGCETAARVLVLFVSERLNGSQRLSAVITKADGADIVSPLIHLPSKLSNVLISNTDGDAGFEVAHVFKEEEYYASLAEAIYTQAPTSDIYRDRIVEALLRRIVLIKKVDILVSRFIDKKDPEKAAALILKAPQSVVQSYMYSLLNCKVSLKDERYLQNTLQLLVSKSKVIEGVVINHIPFQRPLFQRPRSALKRLVEAVITGSGPTAVAQGLMITAEQWSNEDFAKGADILLQKQVTRLLLYYIRYTKESNIADYQDPDNSIMLVLAQGVHFRLSENDIRLRRHGMVVGEAASRYCSEREPLQFDRDSVKSAQNEDEKVFGNETVEDGGDSDFSELANGEGPIAEPIENIGVESSESIASSSGNGEETASVYAKKTRSTRKKSRWKRNMWVEQTTENNWQNEDDWSSISSYEMTDSSDDEDVGNGLPPKKLRQDYEELRKKLAAPMSVPRLLGLLRDICSPDGGATKVDGATATAALRTLSARASQSFMKKGAIHSTAVELCLHICRIDCDQYPDSEMPELIKARASAYENCIQLDIGNCGIALVEKIICGDQSDISRRSEALSFLSTSIRKAYEGWKKETSVSEDQSSRSNGSKVTELGVVTRRLSESLRVSEERRRTNEISKKRKMEWNVEGIERLFHCLAGRLCEGGGASFLNIEERDSRLWAQGLVTLATIACHGGSGIEGSEMRYDVMEIAIRRVGKLNGDGVVRRSIALALGAILGSMEDIEVKEKLIPGLSSEMEILTRFDNKDDIAKECGEWLNRSANNDSDVGVRRFAIIALRKWISRVEAVSS